MFGNYNRAQEVLHKPFNIAVHKDTFRNYLEVCIDEDGTVHYAVPSHQEFLISRLIGSKYATKDELFAAVPVEYHLDMMTWLTKETHMISVWTRFYEGEPNDAQLKALQKLKDAGVYLGEV